MLQCAECGCVSEDGRGWLAFHGVDPDDDELSMVGVFCPPCAEREFERQSMVPGYL